MSRYSLASGAGLPSGSKDLHIHKPFCRTNNIEDFPRYYCCSAIADDLSAGQPGLTAIIYPEQELFRLA